MNIKHRFTILLCVFILVAIITSLIAVTGTSVRAASSWWDAAWSNRATLTITDASGAALSNYQVRIVVPYVPGMKPDYSDIRFVDSSNNPLSYWIEEYTAGVTATFWVKVPSVPASGGVLIDMYYGNLGASSLSNIHSTFIWGDDFEIPPGQQPISPHGVSGVPKVSPPAIPHKG